MLFFDPMYWLFIAPALLLMLFAQWRVKSAYAKWGKVPTTKGIPAVKAAEQLRAENNLYAVQFKGIPGELTDNYDPRSKTLNLSESTARGSSVAQLAVVAHEMGHAQQDASGSLLLRARGGLVPAVNFGSQLGPILFIVGFFLRFSPLMWVGVAFFSMAFLFALVTLPVEIDASSRALKMLRTSNILVSDREMAGARAVLTAAALTYVAAMVTALVQLLYYVLLASSGSRRRR